METRNRTQTIDRQPDAVGAAQPDDVGRTQERLTELLALNEEYRRSNALYSSDVERREAESILNPLSTEKALSWFGLMLGLFPPAALFGKAVIGSGDLEAGNFWVVFLLLLVNAVCAATGYFSGRLIGKIVAEMEKLPWLWMLLVMPFIGLLWGIIAGGAGGVFLFIIGAVFGAVIGGLVGSFALPLFAVFHRLFKRGDVIDRNLFLPISLGIAIVISAFIIGV